MCMCARASFNTNAFDGFVLVELGSFEYIQYFILTNSERQSESTHCFSDNFC